VRTLSITALHAKQSPQRAGAMSHAKKHRKIANFNMRIDPQLKAEFAAVAETEDVSAGQALRTFMRRYIAKHRNANKPSAKWDDGLDQLT
jgi:predicted HicB family RNase H-like nuclease